MALRSRHHRLIRFLCAVVTAGSLTYMAQQSNVRKDVTRERISEITGATTELVKSISPDRPVVIHAYISKEVPREYVTTRARLLNILREFKAAGAEGLTVRIIEPEPYSPEAEEASDKYQIEPVRLMNREGGRLTDMQVFLGLAMVSGPHEDVIPFFDRGLSVEYELVRALRTVTQEKKKVVGVLRTDATIMGNFDLQARRQDPAWRVIGELKKQYEVRSLNPKAAVPEDVDVLLVPQLSSCAQDELDHVKAYIDAGRPALLTVDPFPLFDLRLAPREPKLPPPGQQNQMFGMQQEGAEPKGDYEALLRHVGVEWNPDKIVFDLDNPNKIAAQAPPHIVFMTRPFEGGDPIVDGLSEVVALFGGSIAPVSGAEAEFVPLLQVGDR
ncbi:MAG: GldG family protein, partial [Myxococcales bacterium]|nr:GldG family protein [Myxococcales bacterium]